MTQVLPTRHEAQQLCKLRGLRVTRAREGVAKAQAEVDRVTQLIARHQRDLEARRNAVDDLALAVVTSLAPALPRWSGVTAAQKDKLAEMVERAEYALLMEERALEQAQEKLQEARSELTRALAREDAVRGLADQTRRAHALDRERRAEREIEDQGRPAR